MGKKMLTGCFRSSDELTLLGYWYLCTTRDGKYHKRATISFCKKITR